jgi:hypothetical protein
MSIFDLLHENAHADNDVLIAGDAKDDVFAKPRDVDFVFKTTDKEKAQDLSEYINGKNFGNSRVDGGDDGVFRVLVVIHTPITQHVVCCLSGFMVCLSRLFQVDYDGWGSVVQPVGDGDG